MIKILIVLSSFLVIGPEAQSSLLQPALYILPEDSMLQGQKKRFNPNRQDFEHRYLSRGYFPAQAVSPKKTTEPAARAVCRSVWGGRAGHNSGVPGPVREDGCGR